MLNTIPQTMSGAYANMTASIMGGGMVLSTILGLLWFIISLEIMVALWLLIQKLNKK